MCRERGDEDKAGVGSQGFVNQHKESDFILVWRKVIGDF